ncbi:hypothetical protein QBC43DRAFT_559 [Cladorrhinum sp. PSN259]|nr:hypothetical protein QBC43DRAFT_559 [Cladorrhinum sp. PSN259]
MADDKLNVIALISGGKDSFFSLLHCRANGHRVVALANLHPAVPSRTPAAATTPSAGTTAITADPASAAAISAPVLASTSPDADRVQGVPVGAVGGAPGNEADEAQDEDGHDLNSFMYQTVGHQVIPLYAEATGIPLYRRAIAGGASQHGKDYSHYGAANTGVGPESTAEEDETESMFHVLQAVKAAHPEANAVCAGAILSTYQRTRVESVATRLGLTPLAFLWKYPVLPAPASTGDAQLLNDMAAVGLEARIIKVASGGLDDSFLWTNVADYAGKNRIARAMSKFGAAETGAVIGEGGEFETLVLDGPSTFFMKRVVVKDQDKKVVREGGGSSWLNIRNAKLEDKQATADDTRGEQNIRIPDLLDPDFVGILDAISTTITTAQDINPKLQNLQLEEEDHATQPLPFSSTVTKCLLQHWTFSTASPSLSIQEETSLLLSQIRARLEEESLAPQSIISSTILLRSMSSFALINPIYASLFTTAPNPPSRVCVSVGDTLPLNSNIVIIFTVHPTLPLDLRQGLHVQSRSYWAPANIGPYSQAVWFPLSDKTNSHISLVNIAGQIPLVPRTMALPEANELKMEVVLALQHLWRIGIETGVKFWGFGVAFYPTTKDREGMQGRAKLAGKTWELVHRGKEGQEDEDEDEESEGPDLWDRRYNSAYMSYADEKKKYGGEALPDWSVVKKGKRGHIPPPVFVAEVDELPRGAGVEWQGGLGIRGVNEGEVEVGVVEGGRVWQVVVGDEKGKRFVQSVVVERFVDEKEEKQWEGEKDAVVAARYVNAGADCFVASGGLPVVPCKSLWDGNGERLKAVTVYQGVI